MPFVANTAQLKGLAVVGMAKNVGKTESLNYVFGTFRKRYPELQLALALIGIDGELHNQVTQTDKPEVTLHEGMRFVTMGNFFREKFSPAEIFDIDRIYSSPIGQLVHARARGISETLIASPLSTEGLRRVVTRIRQGGVDLVLIDGALSRLSLVSPSVAEGIMLAAGSVYSAQPEQFIERIRKLIRLIHLPQLTDRKLAEQLARVDKGVRLLTDEEIIVDPGFASALTPGMWRNTTWLVEGDALYVPGVVSGKLLSQLRFIKRHRQLVVKDFTRISVSGQAVQSYLATGGEIETLYSSKLMAVTFNPLASSGYRLGSERMCRRLSETLEVPIYDVRKL